MDIHLQIADEVADGKRAVLLNQELSHHLQVTDLDDVLGTARRQAWKSNRDEGRALGRQLYDLLNGSGGQMHALIQGKMKGGKRKGDATLFPARKAGGKRTLPFSAQNCIEALAIF